MSYFVTSLKNVLFEKCSMRSSVPCGIFYIFICKFTCRFSFLIEKNGFTYHRLSRKKRIPFVKTRRKHVSLLTMLVLVGCYCLSKVHPLLHLPFRVMSTNIISKTFSSTSDDVPSKTFHTGKDVHKHHSSAIYLDMVFPPHGAL